MERKTERADSVMAWMMLMRYSCAITVLLALLCCAAAPAKSSPDDLQIITRRLAAEAPGPILTPAEATKLIAAQRPDGSWPNVQYDDASRTGWAADLHLKYMLELASSYITPGQPLHHDLHVKKSALAAYDYWTRHDFQNPNWWYNQIGTPQMIYRFLLMMKDQVTPSQMAVGLKIMSRAKMSDKAAANLVWTADITFVRGCLSHDPALIRQGIENIKKPLRIFNGGEGIQPDLSFHAHWDQLYTFGYGAIFAEVVSHYAVLTRGTQFAFSSHQLALLARFMLDSQQWLVRGRTGDYSARGRGITRGVPRSSFLLRPCRNMIDLGGPRKTEFQDFAARLTGRESPGWHAPVGNRYFWCSDFMVQRRHGWYTSVRMSSRRTGATEHINSENLKGYRLADGVTYIMRSGQEYTGIFPVWNWFGVPGTTALVKTLHWPKEPRGQTEYVGGVSDGDNGMAAMDFMKYADDQWNRPSHERQKLTAKKAWFFFDDQFVCLGAGISCPAAGDVITTVNQCRLHGNVVADGKDIPDGRHVLPSPHWIWHDGIGYIFTGGPVHLDNQPRSGSWRQINAAESPATVTLPVFDLWIDHGSTPHDQNYAYIVMPNVPLNQMPHDASTPTVRVLSNTTELQAVWREQSEMIEAAFYQPGTLRVSQAMSVQVDQPCLLMIDPHRRQLAASNPMHQALTLNVTITGVPTQHVQLPGGSRGGATVVMTWTGK